LPEFTWRDDEAATGEFDFIEVWIGFQLRMRQPLPYSLSEPYTQLIHCCALNAGLYFNSA